MVRAELRRALSDEGALMTHVVQRVCHQDAVEVSERPRLLREVRALMDDARSVTLVRQRAQSRCILIDGVDCAPRRQQRGEGKSERSIPATEVSPGRRPGGGREAAAQR